MGLQKSKAQTKYPNPGWRLTDIDRPHPLVLQILEERTKKGNQSDRNMFSHTHTQSVPDRAEIICTMIPRQPLLMILICLLSLLVFLHTSILSFSLSSCVLSSAALVIIQLVWVLQSEPIPNVGMYVRGVHNHVPTNHTNVQDSVICSVLSSKRFSTQHKHTLLGPSVAFYQALPPSETSSL